MSFPIIVQPGMSMPITVGTIPTGTTDNSMKVKFAVQAPDFGGVSILISICIKVRIGSVTIQIYYTRYTFAVGQIEYFDSLLPIGSSIEAIEPSFVVVETVAG